MNLFRKRNNIKKAEENLEDDIYDENNDLDIDDKNDFNDIDSFADNNYGISPIDKHNDLLKELTNFKPFLKELRYQFTGKTWNTERQKYIINPNIKPLMNEAGAEWCINYLSVFTRDNNILSSLLEKHFNATMQDAIDVIGINIATRCEEFGINKETEIGDCIKILDMMEKSILFILSGAGKTKNYQEFLGTAVTRHENIAVNNNPNIQNQKNNGIMQNFDKSFSWLRGR